MIISYFPMSNMVFDLISRNFEGAYNAAHFLCKIMWHNGVFILFYIQRVDGIKKETGAHVKNNMLDGFDRLTTSDLQGQYSP